MFDINFNCAEGLKNFKKPVLIIQGKEDLVPESISDKAHSVLSNSKLVILDDCGHYGWLDQPEKYYSDIEKFLHQFD